MMHTLFQVRLLMGLVPALGAVLWLGMDGEETRFEKSPAEITAALSAATVPTHVLGSYVKGSQVWMPDASTVVTALMDENGLELMRFVTTVTSDGTGSLVDTEVRAPEGEHAQRAAKAMESHAFTMSLMDKLADEHVAAAIEGRPFDMMFGNPVAKEMLRADPELAKQIDQTNAAAMEFSQMEADLEDAEAAGYGDSDAAFGAPMDSAQGSF